MNFKLSHAAAAAFAVALLPSAVKAADIDIVFAIPATTLTFTSVFIAEDAGFFKKEGLNVTFRNLVGVASNNAVIGGSADFSVGTAATFLRGAAQGQRMFAIANMVNRPLVELVLSKEAATAAGITDKTPVAERAKALKGKTIGVQGVGSIVHAMQRVVARMGGLDPENDMRIAPMNPPAMLPALKAKQIDGYATSMPFTTRAVADGSAVMIASGPAGDLKDYLPFDYLVLYTRPEVCRNEREKCAKMARAFKNAAAFIQDKPVETLEIVKKRFTTMDPALLEAAWEDARKAHTRDVRVTIPGFTNSQKFSVDAGLLDAKDTLSDFTGLHTDEFVK